MSSFGGGGEWEGGEGAMAEFQSRLIFVTMRIAIADLGELPCQS